MNKKQAKNRIEELNKLTAYYATKYYDDDSPEISDFEYDMLMNELKNLEKEFPEFISKNSLTQKVGGTVKEGFAKVEHVVPLQSLQDVFSIEEVQEFDVKNWKPEHISLSDEADIMVIAPATANTISKIAQGIADNLLTSIACAFSKYLGVLFLLFL